MVCLFSGRISTFLAYYQPAVSIWLEISGLWIRVNKTSVFQANFREISIFSGNFTKISIFFRQIFEKFRFLQEILRKIRFSRQKLLIYSYRGVKKFCITQILYGFSTSSAIISNLF